MSGDHSLIAPSSAGVWVHCTAHPLMAACFPEPETEESREGTATHEVAARMIEAATGAATIPDPVGTIAGNGVVITEEMYESAQMYADNVIGEMQRRGAFGGDCLGVEKRVYAGIIHSESWGTVDCYIFDRKTGELIVWDFKNGHLHVEAFENWQGINYVPGILERLGITGDQDEHIRVTIRIVQPRAFHRDGPIRDWTVKATALRPYWNDLYTKAHEALGPSPVATSGPHCRHCPARHACDAALTAGLTLYEAAAEPAPLELSVEALALQFTIVTRAIDQLKYLASGYEEQIASLIRSGARVPGYRVETGRGRTTWTVPIDEVVMLGDALGVDLRKAAAVTPNQAKKLGIDETVIKAYSDKPITGVKVVRDESAKKAREIFT